MKSHHFVPSAILLLATAALYGWFLQNPVVFDDLYFMVPGVPEHYLENIGFRPRVLSYATIAWGWTFFGTSLLPFRFVSLLLHASVAIALYYFLHQIHRSFLVVPERPSLTISALAGALIFAVHPIAVYGAAYLIQRSIVIATLFALLSWIFFLHGLRAGGKRWMWLAVITYGLAVLGKEHAIAVPAVSVALGLWWWRSQSSRTTLWAMFRPLLPAFVAQAAIGLLTLLCVRGILGGPYEIDAPAMLDLVVVDHPWALSVVTQASFFFKYMFLWLVPNPMWMSVDMREVFVTSLFSWTPFLGFLAFLIWPALSMRLLWKGDRLGLVGFALLAPWLLFVTELATVRIQEPFVLYRSYLWAAPAFGLFSLLENKLNGRVLAMIAVMVPLLLFPLAWNRLTTFTHPLLLWDDAATLVEGREGLIGVERIYRNRGVELARVKKFDLAIEDYTRAIGHNARYSYAYNDRGAALLELGRYSEAIADFDVAIGLRPNYPNSHAGRGRALEMLNRNLDAKDSYRMACELGWRSACAKLELM